MTVRSHPLAHGGLGTCASCGGLTRMAVSCCGRCAEDFNIPGGRARLARRRKLNGWKVS